MSNDDWNDWDQMIEDAWGDPGTDDFDSDSYKAQVKAELVIKLREFLAFATKEELDKLIEEYV